MTPNADTEDLLDRAAAGDAAASHELLARHRPRLKRMLAVRLDDRLAARLDESDVVQEALADAARKLPAYLAERPVAFYPWLRAVAAERLAKLHRLHGAGKRAAGREEAGLGLPDRSALDLARRVVCPRSGPSGSVVRREARARVREAMEELGEQDREVLVLCHLEQLSVAEAAAVLGITEEAAKSRRRRALLRLGELLSDLKADFE